VSGSDRREIDALLGAREVEAKKNSLGAALVTLRERQALEDELRVAGAVEAGGSRQGGNAGGGGRPAGNALSGASPARVVHEECSARKIKNSAVVRKELPGVSM